MKLSISETLDRFNPVEVISISELAVTILDNTYSCGMFKNNHRTSKNFKYADTIALDFDKGSTLEIT